MEQLQLLLVDNDRLFLESIGDALTREGYEVSLIGNGARALEEMSKRSFDLIITDLVLKDMHGFELLEFAKARDSATLVILLTGYGDPDSIISALRNDADDYIIKPVRTRDLFFRINRVFEKQRLREQNQLLKREMTERNRELIQLNADLIKEIDERKAAEERISRALQEKEVLIREIHHRVKNNLAMVASLINLKSRELEDPETVATFNELKQRIKAIHMVHEKIYTSDDIAGINYAHYLDELLRDVAVSLNGSSRPVEVDVAADDIFLDLDTSIPLGLAITELASNSMKHAFPGLERGREGRIAVEFRTRGGELSLRYRDNGAGIPDSLFKHENGEEGSLGIRLIKALTQQIGGTLHAVAPGGVEILFPRPDTR